MKTSAEELIYLADQEEYMRGMLHPDDHGDLRASAVREWALRQAAADKKYKSIETLVGGLCIIFLIVVAIVAAQHRPETW